MAAGPRYDDVAPAVRRNRAGVTALAGGALELRFRLPPGSYATVLVEELFPEGVVEGPS